MKRLDFLKSLSIPFVLPLLSDKKKEPKFQPGDITYFDGKNHHLVSTAHSENELIKSDSRKVGDGDLKSWYHSSNNMTACCTEYKRCNTIF